MNAAGPVPGQQFVGKNLFQESRSLNTHHGSLIVPIAFKTHLRDNLRQGRCVLRPIYAHLPEEPARLRCVFWRANLSKLEDPEKSLGA